MTTTTLTVANSVAHIGHRYRCVAANSVESDVFAEATITP
jgi:hypothetical protein